ncbi:MAG: hypothetical protein E7568_02900 [Ruminococcaceae bacterium]|nr:hypothetical protein [Oscillospiraceae bacterium]
MFYKFKNMLYRFMYGRYGNDSLNNFIFILYLVLAVLNIFIGSYLIYIFATFLILISFFRMLSRNINKRSAENRKFLNIKSKAVSYFSLLKRRFNERKIYVYKKCPYCKAILRLPRKKGKHTCNCPKCYKSFKMRVY